MQELGVAIIGVDGDKMLKYLNSTSNVSFYGTAFRAVDVKAIDRSDEELKQEKIPSLDNENTTTIPQDKLDISYETTHKLDDSSLVAFKDPVNNKWVILSLKNDTIDKLKEHFGEDDFYKKENGIIRLDNKAEAYVAGWYADIAYKREFLKADSNHDGILDDSEYANTRNDFQGYGELILNGAKEQITDSYVKVYENTSDIVRYNNEHYKRPKNLDEELDTTLRINTNFDDKITLREAYNTNKHNSVLSNLSLMDKHIQEAEKKGFISKDAIMHFLKYNDDELKKLKALQKLHTNPNSLTPEEKELVMPELQALKNKDGEIDKDKLNQTIKTMQVTQKYLENMVG